MVLNNSDDDVMLLARQLFKMIVAARVGAERCAVTVGKCPNGGEQPQVDSSICERNLVAIDANDFFEHKHGSPSMNGMENLQHRSEIVRLIDFPVDTSSLLFPHGTFLTEDFEIMARLQSKHAESNPSEDARDVQDELEDSIHLAKRRLKKCQENGN